MVLGRSDDKDYRKRLLVFTLPFFLYMGNRRLAANGMGKTSHNSFNLRVNTKSSWEGESINSALNHVFVWLIVGRVYQTVQQYRLKFKKNQ